MVFAPSIPISFNLEMVLFPAPPAPTTIILARLFSMIFINSSSKASYEFLCKEFSMVYSDSLIELSINFKSKPQNF